MNILSCEKMGQEKNVGGVLYSKKTNVKKTGGWRYQKPVWDKSKCINCMLCYTHCPENAISLKKGKDIKRGKTNFDFCKGCGLCAKICPVKCIKMEKEE